MPRPIAGFAQLMRKYIEAGQFRAVIDRRYPLEQIREAYAYVEAGQKTGIVVINVQVHDRAYPRLPRPCQKALIILLDQPNGSVDELRAMLPEVRANGR